MTRLSQTGEIPGPHGATIRFEVQTPTQPRGRLPVVVVCHGFGVSKDWGFYPVLRAAVCDSGFTVVAFNYSHSGVLGDSTRIIDLERFRRNSLTMETIDLRIILNAIKSGAMPFASRCDSSRIGLIAHSRGADSALEVAATDSAVRAIVTLAAKSHLRTVTPDQELTWRQNKQWMVFNFETGGMLPLGTDLLEDLCRNRDRIENAVRRLEIPYLILHGEQDLWTSTQAARTLASWAKHPTLAIIQDTGHSFDFESGVARLCSARSVTLAAIEEFLAKQFQCYGA